MLLLIKNENGELENRWMPFPKEHPNVEVISPALKDGDGNICPVEIIDIVDGVPVLSHTKREIQDNLRHIAQQKTNALVYKKHRRSEYPSELEIIEALMEDKEGRPEKLEEIKSRRADVKTKYPKPE